MKDLQFPVIDKGLSLFLVRRFKEDLEPALSRDLQEHRGISRQAATTLLSRLVKQGVLSEGKGKRPKTYRLVEKVAFRKKYALKGLEEHVVWALDLHPLLAPHLSPESLSIWEYGVTEMINNAIDHSEGTAVRVTLLLTAISATCTISDDGEGIFRRIKRLCKLADERQAILELAKGKLTTDQANHSGEGVFFTSRAFEKFRIMSGDLHFSHPDGKDDFLLEREKASDGTTVVLTQGHHTDGKTLAKVFDEYAAPDEYTFSKTVVPVKLARMASENLVSRSQAQRLLARIDRFKTVILDFSEVESIGQAFADEIFRVFRNAHPEVEFFYIRASGQVLNMIKRAENLS